MPLQTKKQIPRGNDRKKAEARAGATTTNTGVSPLRCGRDDEVWVVTREGGLLERLVRGFDG